MSGEDLKRAEVLSRVEAEELTQWEAAEWLELSYRQTKRLWQRYRQEGAAGLVHGNVGQRSHHAKPEAFRRRVLSLVRRYYSGEPGERFGPTLAAEHLAEDHGLAVDAETLRRWMVAAGLWSRERKRKPYRKRRPRKAHFGELVQLDGSFHDWLEERGPRGCLINLVDDATGVTLARFAHEETTWAVAEALRAWVETYGIPRGLYADFKNVYQHEPTERQQRAGETPVSQFGQICARLGITLIGAGSPQAKGRVERNHGVHQDRLIKKMRLRKISSYEEANRFLEQVYLAQHNARYAQAPADPVDFHESWPPRLDWEEVFCLEQERVVSNDWVVRYANRLLQLEKAPGVYVPAGSRVVVRELRDGSLQLLYQRQRLAWREIQQRPLRSAQPLLRVRRVRVVPPADHPWRRPLRPQQQQPETEIHRDNGRRAVEMTGCGKPEAGFPHPLGNSPTTRVSHIPTAPTTTVTHTPKGTFLSR